MIVQCVVTVCFLLFVGVNSLQGGDPIVNIIQTDPETENGLMIVTQGGFFRIDCKVENLGPLSNVKWRKEYWNPEKNGSDSFPISKGTGSQDNTLYDVQKTNDVTWSLYMNNVQRHTGDGVYVCFVTTTLSTEKSDRREVRVKSNPVFIMGKVSDETKVVEGEELDLICEAEGYPKPTIMWLKKGSQASSAWSNRYQTRFTIPKVTKDDAGMYQCFAQNSLKTIHKDIKVTVDYKPQIFAVTIVRQKVGYLIELQCTVMANPVPVGDQVYWKSGNEMITSTSGRLRVKTIYQSQGLITELIIAKVEKQDYDKTYSCVISNKYGQSEKIIQLKETDQAQKSFKLGRIISGACSVKSHTEVIVATALITAIVSTLLNKII